jgi:GNAT superfamily N-acetyltransferase
MSGVSAVEPPEPVVVGAADVENAVAVLTSAFAEDPTWAWVFPDPALRPAQHAWLWRQFVEGARRYPWVWLSADRAATAVWVPPGGTDWSPEQEAELEEWIEQLPGEARDRARAAVELFEAAHPRDEPHYFLSLLGTHAAHRGKGIGFGLLADNLRAVDEAGMPAYLEASNPDNVVLYQRFGFQPHGSFVLPDGPRVVTMWREPGPVRTKSRLVPPA